jgi:hypothetical protein
MRYIRNQFVRAGSFMWWIFIFMISGALLWGGITILQWSWAGIFNILIGVAILFRLIIATSNRSKIRRIVLDEFEKNPEASIKDVTGITGISRRDVRAIILDWKSSGHLIGNFSTKAGTISYISNHKEQNTLGEKSKYCQSCGTPIRDESVQYCTYCGAKI